ncbi:MAG: acyl carrier protein [Candidatus Microbacterium colombiense]|jgi:acyl carrier protein|nr:MAG: acyl carrier protein [Microbacterium sp.]
MNDQEILERVIELWNDALGVDDVTPDEDFFDLGGDSITAIRLLPEIERRFGIEAKVALVFDNATARELSQALVRELADHAL